MNISKLFYHQDIILKKLKLGSHDFKNEMTLFNLGSPKKRKKTKEDLNEHGMELSAITENIGTQSKD